MREDNYKTDVQQKVSSEQILDNIEKHLSLLEEQLSLMYNDIIPILGPSTAGPTMGVSNINKNVPNFDVSKLNERLLNFNDNIERLIRDTESVRFRIQL